MNAVRRLVRSDLFQRVAANCSARVAAVVGLAVATIVVARVGGPAAVGTYALMRMLPGLAGVLCVGGLPGALAYFLAAPRRTAPRTWSTILAITAVGSALGTAAWCLATPLLQRLFFRTESGWVVMAAGATVATQMMLTVGKTALQGLENRRAGDVVIAAEELAFLPCYAAPLLLGASGTPAILLGLGLADLAVAALAWRAVGDDLRRLRGPDRRARVVRDGRPDPALARQIISYGTRGQVGGLLTLLNLRLDFAILDALAGPAVLGTYAVASKFAELLRLPGTALTWVSYPQLAGSTPVAAARRARRLAPPALAAVWAAGLPLFVLAGPATTLLYGARFADAVPQARVLLVGMLLGGAAGVASGYLYARGRPGLNSVGMGIGVVLTVVLDATLIPAHGAMGAAIASTIAYLVSDGALIVMLLRLSRPARTAEPAATTEEVVT
jgi:O-antigen/teichoic acid export membrane protein